MEPVFFVLAILGCGDAGEACREVRAEAVRYVTRAQCRAAITDALTRSTALDFPVIEADCRPSGVQIASAAAR